MSKQELLIPDDQQQNVKEYLKKDTRYVGYTIQDSFGDRIVYVLNAFYEHKHGIPGCTLLGSGYSVPSVLMMNGFGNEGITLEEYVEERLVTPSVSVSEYAIPLGPDQTLVCDGAGWSAFSVCNSTPMLLVHLSCRDFMVGDRISVNAHHKIPVHLPNRQAVSSLVGRKSDARELAFPCTTSTGDCPYCNRGIKLSKHCIHLFQVTVFSQGAVYEAVLRVTLRSGIQLTHMVNALRGSTLIVVTARGTKDTTELKPVTSFTFTEDELHRVSDPTWELRAKRNAEILDGLTRKAAAKPTVSSGQTRVGTASPQNIPKSLPDDEDAGDCDDGDDYDDWED